MINRFIIYILTVFFLFTTQVKAQNSDSTGSSKAKKHMDKNFKDVSKIQGKIEKKQKHIEKQQKRIEKQQRKKERKMKRIKKEEKKDR